VLPTVAVRSITSGATSPSMRATICRNRGRVKQRSASCWGGSTEASRSS